MVNRVPPVSEASFRREYSLMWTVAGGSCIVIGEVVGPMIAHAHRPWLTLLVACLVYAFSLLLCRVVLIAMWRRPNVTPAVLYFSIPVGALCLIAVLIMKWLAPTLELGKRSLFVFALSMGLLYAAALIWGIGVGIRRKALGEFEVDNRP
jgi:hypothetical protein